MTPVRTADLEGIVDEPLDIELRYGTEHVLPERLPVRHRVGDHPDEGRRTQNRTLLEVDVGDRGGDVVLERLVEIQKDQGDDDSPRE